MKRHSFITIEGLSGSGKTTIAKLLAKDIGAFYYSSPPSLFAPIRSAINLQAAPFARHLFYYAGIAQASVDIVALLSRNAVVCDKYVATMLAYSRASGIDVAIPSPDFVRTPDVAFFLQVDEDVRMHRLQMRGTITEEHAAFLSMERSCKVVDHYRPLGLVAIDNQMASAVATSECIKDHLALRGFL